MQLTFQQALDLARKNATQFQAAVVNAGVLHEDAKQARNTLLPTVTYDNSALYTQGTGASLAAVQAGLKKFVESTDAQPYLP